MSHVPYMNESCHTVWNLKEVAPKDGYTSNVRVSTAMLGWGKDKETDTGA